MDSKEIVILGAGNVATHLSRHLHARGHRILCIWSPGGESARQLARELDCGWTSLKPEIPGKADFYVFCIPDHAVSDLALDLAHCRGCFLHTAGALSMDVFSGRTGAYGVLYPLQTLSRKRILKSAAIPFLVEASSREILEQLKALASSISDEVREADSASRLKMHLAAVFANNFSNHMVTVARELAREWGMDPDLLKPLLEETYAKLLELGAREAQTGPAVRGDVQSMERHINLLQDHPEWQNLYTFISRDIMRSRKT